MTARPVSFSRTRMGRPYVRVQVLGQVRAWVGEREADLGPARQRALFAVLAAQSGRWVSRDELIAAVWGTSPPATAAGSIYTYVSGLRRAFGPDRGRRLVQSGPSGYLLTVDAGGLDAEEFQRLRAAAAERVAAGDRTGALSRLDDALRLWHGEPYAGLAAPFLELDRERLSGHYLQAVELRARIRLELGRDDGLVAELAGLVRAHPLVESLHELLMRALYRAERHAEALDAYRHAARVLREQLGVEPGAALRDLHQRLLQGEPDEAPAQPGPVLPGPVARALRDGLADRPCFGREDDVAHLRGLVQAVALGNGGTVWIDGEPGIGKTELLTCAFADAGTYGCRVAWATADELGQRVALRVLLRALDIDGPGDPDEGPVAAVDRVLAYVRASCAGGPLVLVVDDMHWADATTILAWERLIPLTARLPLLLVAAARPDSNRRELSQVRRAAQVRQQRPLDLRPLAPADLERLVAHLAGAPIGEHLRALAARTGGNPLYAREMVAALLRSGAVRTAGGVAEVDATVTVEPPESLLAAVRATVDFLSPATSEVLRVAALLGNEFAVADVVAVTGQSVFELYDSLAEALAARVVVDTGENLAFRHPFLRTALNEGVPAPLRAGLHRHAAEVLAAGGRPITRVAEQLAAESPVIDGWVAGWLAEHHVELSRRAPQLAGDLMRRVLDTPVPTPAEREALLVALVRIGVGADEYPMDEAARALALTRDPAVRAELRLALATMRFRQGDAAGAIALLRDAMDEDMPRPWRTRHQVLLAQFRRGTLDDLDSAERDARSIAAEATTRGQPFEAAFALQTIWLTSSIRRDHERALRHANRGLRLMRDAHDGSAMYADLLDNRVFSLQNLDRLEEAEAALSEGGRGLQMAAAVQHYWRGRWDQALAEIGSQTGDDLGRTVHGAREPGAGGMVLHGVAALIAAHRGRPDEVAAHVAAADALPATEAEREACDFLLVARALVEELDGRPADALWRLPALLTPDYAPMMLRHQWLPVVIRLALAADRPEAAKRAGAIAAAEAAREVVPARAYAAAARCRALLTGDPRPALDAARHYGVVGRVPERAAALEDAAVLYNRRNPGAARPVAREAARLFTGLGAAGDLSRLRWRMGSTGIELTAAC